MKLLRKITKQDIVVIAFIFVISALIGFGVAQVAKHNIVQHSAPVQALHYKFQPKVNDTILNKENFEKFVYSLPFSYPDIIIKQCYWETGHLSSNLCKKCNNLFGMRKNYSNVWMYYEHNGWSVYKNWKLSVIDRLEWDYRWATDLNRQEYLNFLQRIYCNKNIDTNYIQKINSIKIKTI